MSDERRRDLERRAQLGDLQAEERLLRERTRTGEPTPHTGAFDSDALVDWLVASGQVSSRQEGQDLLQVVQAGIQAGLTKGESVVIEEFGQFRILTRKVREGRSPMTGGLPVKKSWTISFKPHIALKRLVDPERRRAAESKPDSDR